MGALKYIIPKEDKIKITQAPIAESISNTNDVMI